MAILTGTAVGKQLCETLGIDPSMVTRVEIDARVGSVAVVRLTEFVRSDDGKLTGLECLREYELVLKEQSSIEKEDG